MHFKNLRWPNKPQVEFTTKDGVSLVITKPGDVRYNDNWLARLTRRDDKGKKLTHGFQIGDYLVAFDTLLGHVWRGADLTLEQLSLATINRSSGGPLSPGVAVPACFPDHEAFWFQDAKGERYKLIPFFTKYAMSKDGHLLSLETMTRVNLTYDKNGEVAYRIAADTDYDRIPMLMRVAELMCLAFMDFPGKISEFKAVHTGRIHLLPALDQIEIQWTSVKRKQGKATAATPESSVRRKSDMDKPENVMKRKSLLMWARPSSTVSSESGNNEI